MLELETTKECSPTGRRHEVNHFKDLETCEANYRGIEQANKINYHLMLWEQSKWETIYRLVFPEEAPWGRVVLGPGITCSPYQWEKLIQRLTELLRNSGKEPADGWQGKGGYSTPSFPDLSD